MKTFKSIEEEIQTLSQEELLLWNKGYLAAIEGLLADIQDNQIKILNRLLTLDKYENKEGFKGKLESMLSVLDVFEDRYKKRLHCLRRDAE